MRRTGLIIIILAILLSISSCVSRGDLTSNYQTLPTRSQKAANQDNAIIKSLNERISQNQQLSQAHINVNSYDGYILLTGQVPSQQLKQLVTQFAETTKGKKALLNDISIAENTSGWQRIKDTWLSSRVIASLRNNAAINADRVQVVTENNVVYLMGMIAPYEANSFVNTISAIPGIDRIVKVFEYVS